MPPPVDHEARRRKIAEIAAEVIARDGLEAATVRRVAAAAGYSTTVVTHYFASKRELLLWTYRVTAEHAQVCFDATQARDPSDLLGCLETLLPIDEAGVRAWRVNFAFWQRASTDREFADEQRWWMRNAASIIGEVVRYRYGDAPDLERKARMLVVALMGIAVQAVFDDRAWTAAVQREHLRLQIVLLFGSAVGARDVVPG